jgi:acyl phosphate:glycerol-3-phosphate acyltransferase
MLDILKDIGIIIGSFLVGAIPFCFILGKIIGGKRLTEIGDKNPGGWNLVFNVSKIWGLIGILLDMAKGYFAYYLAYRFSSAGTIEILGATNHQLIAILAGCAAVAGHNYTPYLKFNGGKGLATWGGFMIAVNPFSFFTAAAGLLARILVARNMIWSVSLGIIFTGIFLWIYKGSVIFIIMILLLLVIMVPKQVNREIKLGLNFKFRKEATLGDLFKPKIR